MEKERPHALEMAEEEAQAPEAQAQAQGRRAVGSAAPAWKIFSTAQALQ